LQEPDVALQYASRSRGRAQTERRACGGVHESIHRSTGAVRLTFATLRPTGMFEHEPRGDVSRLTLQ